MRKIFFSAVVIALAGTCWVMAQIAANERPASPYGLQVPTPSTPGTGSPAMIPVSAINMPVTIPTTELGSVSIPELPVVPTIDIPEPPKLVPVPQPEPQPVMKPVPLPVAVASEPAPLLQLPPDPRAVAVPQPLMIPIIEPMARPLSLQAAAPQPQPIPVVEPIARPVPPMPLPPPVNPIPPGVTQAPFTPTPTPPIVQPAPAKPLNRAVIKASSPIIPALPAVPGVQADFTGVSPDLVMQNPQGPGVRIEQMPTPPGYQPPTASYSVDAPSGIVEGQPIFNDSESNAAFRRMGPRIWASAEYLLWFSNTQKLPPLARGITGVQPGDNGYDEDQVVNYIPTGNGDARFQDGVRGTFGFWFNDAQTLGFEASYFWMGPQRMRDTYRSSSDVILGRPFVYAPTGESVLFQTSSLDDTAGVIRVWQRLHVDGGEANFMSNPLGIAPRLKFIAGFRFLQTSEGLAVGYRATDDANGFSAEGLDTWETRNRFYGGQVGLRWSYEGRRLFASFTGKIAYGSMQERVHIYGGTRVDNSGTITEAQGGVLALPSNIGSYHRSRMAYIPEATAQIGYNFTPWASAFVGYNFMYISNLARPGSQVDLAVDPENFPFNAGGGARPGFQFKDDSLWLQGVNFGVSFRY